jgi:glycosyltransferase involved in cell wall biosynthesis
MVDRFNALSERKNLRFEAWFNQRFHHDRSWKVSESKWKFQYRYVPAIRFPGFKCRLPLLSLAKKKPDVLVSLYAEPIFLMGWMIARARGVKTIFRTLKTFDQWVPRKRWKEYLKRYIFKRVDGIETPGIDGRNYVLKYGAPKDKIFFATHAIDINHFQNSVNISLKERNKIRNNLGLTGITFICVGRLWWGKGLIYLLDAFRDLQKVCNERMSLLLVGDGNDEKILKKKCKVENIRNVVLAGFQQKEKLPDYYAIADVLVFPTLGDPYGIVVNEAMACSLPVISTSTAGEISSRIEDGVNGYIIPPKNSILLKERMERLVYNSNLRKKMGEVSARKISRNGIEKWADEFEKIIAKVLSE